MFERRLEQGAEPDRSHSPPLHLIEDRGQSLDGLTAVAGAPGSVSVVQEQDCARPEVPTSALDDRRDAWFGRIEDAASPAANAVAEAADRVAEPGAAHAMWSPKKANRGPTGGRDDRPFGCEQLRTHSGWWAEGEQPVVEAVACDLVAVGEYLPEHLRAVACVCAEDEEGRPMSALGQQSAYRWREAGVGSIVEGKREAAGFVTYPGHASEQWGGRRERP